MAPKPDPKRDEPVKIDLDPEVAFRALLAVDPSGEPATCLECGHPRSEHRRPPGTELMRGKVPEACRVEGCGCRLR